MLSSPVVEENMKTRNFVKGIKTKHYIPNKGTNGNISQDKSTLDPPQGKPSTLTSEIKI